MMHYTKVDGLFKLIDDETGEVLIASPVIAILFDKEFGTLHKHGAPADVLERYEFMIDHLTYTPNGLRDMGQWLVVVKSPAWDLEVLNKCLNISGYPAVMARQYGLKIDPPIGDQFKHIIADEGKYPPFAYQVYQHGKEPVTNLCDD